MINPTVPPSLFNQNFWLYAYGPKLAVIPTLSTYRETLDAWYISVYVLTCKVYFWVAQTQNNP